MARRIIAIKIIFFISFFLLPAARADNASLYLSPSSGTYSVGNTFSVDIRTNTGGVAINASQGTLVFPTNELKVVSLSKAGSIFSLWTGEPSFSNSAGSIFFGGGVPNPGYTGASGKIITITFKTKVAGTANVSFSSGAVLANDGLGTNILSSLGSGSYQISGKGQKEPVIKKPIIKEDLVEEDVPEVISITHPDQDSWYKNDKAIFEWKLTSGTTGVSILLDDKSRSNPGPVSDGLFRTKEYENLEDGIYYFHLKLKDKNGWSGISHFRIQIDTKDPESLNINVKKDEETDLPILELEALDLLSGIDKFEIKIGDQTYIIDSDSGSERFKIPLLFPGNYTAIVKAIDKAGNSKIEIADFKIIALETPVIKSYSEEFKSSDKFFISGTALVDIKVNIFIQKEGSEKIITKAVQSDKNGNWYLIYEEGLANGRYIAWAEAVNSYGLKSHPSNKVSFLVTPPVFTKIGSFVIEYFTVLVSLLFMIILIVALLLFIIVFIKRKLKKETLDIEEVLHSNLDGLKKSVDKELIKLNKFTGNKANFNKERAKINMRLKKKINETEKKILKEIKDVEKLLK